VLVNLAWATRRFVAPLASKGVQRAFVKEPDALSATQCVLHWKRCAPPVVMMVVLVVVVIVMAAISVVNVLDARDVHAAEVSL
jgi:hypothetical protein